MAKRFIQSVDLKVGDSGDLLIEEALAAWAALGYVIQRATFSGKLTTETLIAAVAGKELHVVGGMVTCGVAAGTMTFRSNTTAISAAYDMVVGSGLTIAPRPMTRPMWRTAVGEAFTVAMTGSGQTVSGDIEYIEV